MKLDLNMTVRELLRDHPSAMDVFIERKMLCVGCPAQAFHTLGDVVRLYGLDGESFMASLDQHVQQEG
ncbi:MAG: DUF1858 domain-containing protein [Syntrophobacteraceae bacterium]|nr:DUF1858 domain-containing protein [Syntrophobacteraceae bacterium]